MPLYDGIGLINEKHPVVFEIGHSFTKAGFAGEVTPRCILPSRIHSKPIFDFEGPDDLYKNLVDFLHTIYCRYLLVTPKDRKVVIVENIFATTKWRQVLAKVLYLHYEVQNVLWVPSHLAAVTATGGDTALVVDIGLEEIQVIPVYKGITILKATISHELGAASFDNNLKDLLANGCLNRSKESLLELLNDDIVEDIRVRCCVVTNLNRALTYKNHPDEAVTELNCQPFEYKLDGTNFLKFSGDIREKAAEIWFCNEDLDGISLPVMILQCLSTCPIDARLPLAASILLAGGTSMIPGLKGRLLSELKNLASNPDSLFDEILKEKFKKQKYEFRVFRAPVQENCTSWMGGAVYGATEAMQLRGVSKEFFLKNGVIPDWCNLKFDMVSGLSSCGITTYSSASSFLKGL